LLKPRASALLGVETELWGDGGGNLTNVKYKPI
jgi:hypothetical protein